MPQKKNSSFSFPSFRFWVKYKMESSEWKNLGNIFSEVSELSENSEFLTLPIQSCNQNHLHTQPVANSAVHSLGISEEIPRMFFLEYHSEGNK